MKSPCQPLEKKKTSLVDDIWSSKEPCVYPDYTKDDIKLLEHRFIDSSVRCELRHEEGWVKAAREKPTERWVMSTALSMPLSKVKEQLKGIERSERIKAKARKKAGYKPGESLRGDDLYLYGRPLVEAECEVVYRWRLDIGK